MQEREVSRRLAQREDGVCEVKTPVGFIDVLTPTTIYEVKEVKQWKAAVGQLLAYARYYPNHTPKLYLYGPANAKQKSTIKEHCKGLNIGIVWHKEEDDAPVAQTHTAPSHAPEPDQLRLHMLAIDHAEHTKASCSVHIALPAEELTLSALEAHADEALNVFDALLHNELLLSLRYVSRGEPRVVERTRPNIVGRSVYHRFHITVATHTRAHFTISLPGMRSQLPSGAELLRDVNYARATVFPELARLYRFILHPQLPWINRYGEPGCAIKSAYRKKQLP